MIRATVVVLLTGAAAAHAQGSAAINRTLTSIEGVRVGQHTLVERPTGCTVVLFDGEAVGGVSQRGAAPGTRETDLLNPNNMVDRINAIVLSGGSAYGLDAANGAVRWLDEHNIGWDARVARVPMVPSAVLIDLWVGGKTPIRPRAGFGPRAPPRAQGGPRPAASPRAPPP